MSRFASPLVLLCLSVTGSAPSALAGVNDLFVTGDSNTVGRYSGDTGAFQNAFLFSHAASGPLAIHFGTTNNRVLVGHVSGGVEEFNATTGAYIKTYTPAGGKQWAGIYAPNGNVLISEWYSNSVREYDSTTGAFVRVVTTIAGPGDMSFGPNGHLYVCSYTNGFVQEVDATTGQYFDLWFNPGGAPSNDVAFNPNGEILVSATTANVVYRYDSAYNLLGSFAGTGWGRPHGIAFSPWTGNVLVVDGVTGQVHEFDPTTYAELNPAFLVPPPGGEIVDLAFHGGAVYVNKDLVNSTGQTADAVEVLVQGSRVSTVSTFLGGFPNFTITPAGSNTRFRWSGLATPPGTVRHVGFGVQADEVKILGVSWTLGGTVVGCAPQCNTLYGTYSDGTGVLAYGNGAVDCSAQALYAGNLQIEYYDLHLPDLADMVAGGTRNPLRVDNVPGLVTIPVGETVEVPGAPSPPAAARYSLLVFDVGTDAGLTDATGDFVLTPIDRDVVDNRFDTFCFPNSGGTRSCPCSNQPSPNDGSLGCNNFGPTPAGGTGGAMLSATGNAVASTANTLVFHVTGMQTPCTLVMLFVGGTRVGGGVQSGGGVRCVAALQTPRPYKSIAGFNASSIDFPSASSNPNIDAWTTSNSPVAGVTRHYYAAYRNPALSGHPPCSASNAFNLTNAGSITWHF